STHRQDDIYTRYPFLTICYLALTAIISWLKLAIIFITMELKSLGLMVKASIPISTYALTIQTCIVLMSPSGMAAMSLLVKETIRSTSSPILTPTIRLT
ncbi:hypothetical protein D046_4959C, partial [Vibrio parahaemolyticus V-223/04]